MLPLNNGSVYQYRSKNHFKESWLCLEPDGKLTWKRVDAYQVKGSTYLDEILDQISISGWSKKKCDQNHGKMPFIMRLPMTVQGSKTTKTFMLMNAEDLNSWLSAFATVVGKWRLWRNIKKRQAMKIVSQVTVDEYNVHKVLPYEDLVQFYSAVWKEFLSLYRHGQGDEESMNSHPQNDIIPHQSNGAAHFDNEGPVHQPPPYQYQSTPPPQQNEHVIVATVHQFEVNTVPDHTITNIQQNGKAIDKEIYGDEDSGEEMHF